MSFGLLPSSGKTQGKPVPVFGNNSSSQMQICPYVSPQNSYYLVRQKRIVYVPNYSMLKTVHKKYQGCDDYPGLSGLMQYFTWLTTIIHVLPTFIEKRPPKKVILDVFSGYMRNIIPHTYATYRSYQSQLYVMLLMRWWMRAVIVRGYKENILE